MPSLAYPSLEATFIEIPNALEITQRGRTYRARKWQLTAALIEVINTAIEFGYGCFWVDGHPSKPYFIGEPKFFYGSHHITFARSHEERWAFVVDGSSKPPSPIDVTFNKGLRDFLQRAGELSQWEHAGGHNVRVDRNRLRAVLEMLRPETVDGLQHQAIRDTYAGKLPIIDIYDETQLQLKIERQWASSLTQRGHVAIGRRMVDGWIPDILIKTSSGSVVVVELKFSHAGGVEVDQLQKYLGLPSLQECARKHGIHGVLIARDFSKKIVSDNVSRIAPNSFYSFGQCNSIVFFQLVSGRDILREIGLCEDA